MKCNSNLGPVEMSHFWINLFFYLQNFHLDKQMHSHLLQGIWQPKRKSYIPKS